MAPDVRPRSPSIEHSDEYATFIEKLRQYHEKRGTFFDPEPKLGSRHVDLLKLWKMVNERGGYDPVSAEKLAWKKVGEHFFFGTVQPATFAFNLKTVYYRFLAAYEISTIHGREPPPKEILEDLTARGGDLLSRTVDNYFPPNRTDGGGSGDEGDPKEEPIDDDPNGPRATRGLRQAPAQRVLFQPEVGSSRGRTSLPAVPNSTPSQVMTTAGTPINPANTSQGVANYEPRPPVPVSVRPVVTPSTNPDTFREKQRALRERLHRPQGPSNTPRGMVLPGTGFDGPNIYIRTMLALKSGIEEEQAYALHHLVKISHERGDKYKFSAFPGLAEALIGKILQITELVYNMRWTVTFDDTIAKPDTPYVLDSVAGTPNLLELIRQLKVTQSDDDMETDELAAKLNKISEAALVLRNMVMLEENAAYISKQPLVCDYITIILNLPKTAFTIELQHYALDVAEQVTKYFLLDASHPLFTTLIQQLQSMDRGAVLTALRAIGRISMNLDENSRLRNVPLQTVQRIIDWTVLDDEELISACLDFLYQYSALDDNVRLMTEQMSEAYLAGLVNRLVQLLTFGSQPTEQVITEKRAPQKQAPPKDAIPNMPRALMSTLLQMDEPERSTNWLRACFEEDPNQSITQIALWQAYQARFTDAAPASKPLLPAADFIKNVSSTFSGATAQVLQGPNPRFIIRGICARPAPLDPTTGKTFQRCQWLNDTSGRRHTCGEFHLTARDLWTHILQDHLKMTSLSSPPQQPMTCLWGHCFRTFDPAPDSVVKLSIHLKTHLSDAEQPIKEENDGPKESTSKSTSSSPDASRRSATVSSTGSSTAETTESVMTQFSLNTAVDERGDAAGLPLSAALVLRNFARNLPGSTANSSSTNGQLNGTSIGPPSLNPSTTHTRHNSTIPTSTNGLQTSTPSAMDTEMDIEDVNGSESTATVKLGLGAAAAQAMGPNEPWAVKLFQPVMSQLWFIMAFSKPLAGYIADLVTIVESAE